MRTLPKLTENWYSVIWCRLRQHQGKHQHMWKPPEITAETGTRSSNKGFMAVKKDVLTILSWAQPLIFNSAAHPTHACSSQMWTHLKLRNKQAFPQFTIYCQEALLQQRNDMSNIHFLTFCASHWDFISFFKGISIHPLFIPAYSYLGSPGSAGSQQKVFFFKEFSSYE